MPLRCDGFHSWKFDFTFFEVGGQFESLANLRVVSARNRIFWKIEPNSQTTEDGRRHFYFQSYFTPGFISGGLYQMMS
jgi:hypothetical protein